MRALPLLSVLLLVACDKEDPGVTLAVVQQEVFSPSCALSGCHDDASRQGELYLGEAMDPAELIGAPSVDDPNQIRVVPGAPDDSYLIKKMERRIDEILGEAMPPPFGASEDDRALVREWIENGAPVE